MNENEESNALSQQQIKQLEAENKKLRKKIERLQKTMDIATKHSDVMTGELEGKVEASIKEIEERVRIISDTMPVPIVIAGKNDGKIRFVNEHASRAFGLSVDKMINSNAANLYKNAAERKRLIEALSESGRVSDFEVELKKQNGEMFWASLFSQIMDFEHEVCAITVIYDLTERRKAEDEIRLLKEQLDQKGIKYLIFELNRDKYGIEINYVKEIIGMMPVVSVKNSLPYIKGVINLRGKIIQVNDLRLMMNLEEKDYTEQTCIIIIEPGEKQHKFGIIVDAVHEVTIVKQRDIKQPEYFKTDQKISFVAGMTKLKNNEICILFDVNAWSKT